MQVVSKKSIVKLSSFYEGVVFFVEGEERIERNKHAQNVNENEGIWKKKETVHFSFPPEGGRAAEAFWSLFSHTDGKIRDGYGEDGCGRKVVGTERLILTQHSPYL
jgi:hypothetical protein